MKSLKYLSFVILLLAVFMQVSCTTETEPIDPAVLNPDPVDPNAPGNPGNPSGPAVFKVDFDSQTFTAATTIVYNSGGKLNIIATNASGASFAIIIDGITAGEYDLSADTNSSIFYVPAGDEYGYVSGNIDSTASVGSISLTTVDTVNKKISGTFRFTGYYSDGLSSTNSKVFTNGVFTNLPYVTQNPTGNTLTATVNGAAFTGVDIIGSVADGGSGETINIQGETADGRIIHIHVQDTLALGTYAISTDPFAPVGFDYGLNNDDFGTDATSGSITITAKTADHITGTFSGVVTIDTITYDISNGAFSVDY